MEQVGLALEDLANIGDDFYAMHNIFGGMVRVLLKKILLIVYSLSSQAKIHV